MANYAVLKAAINAVIKTNGNKEITGQVLNQTLMAIVDSLGENYQFAGVAVPSTNPGTPDQNIFYLATQAGTYTNFGATVLPAGISMLEWKNNTWSSETFFTIDDAPTAGSDHLVKSGGVKTAIDNVAFSTNEKVKDVGIDSTPTSGSDNLIKSGAVFDAFKNDGGAYDVSVHFPTGGVEGGNTYTLDGAIAMVPQNMKKGGMSIKFVSSSDNKYVQFRLMSDTFNTTPANWQGVDAEPTVRSRNLVESRGIIQYVGNIAKIEDEVYQSSNSLVEIFNSGLGNYGKTISINLTKLEGTEATPIVAITYVDETSSYPSISLGENMLVLEKDVKNIRLYYVSLASDITISLEILATNAAETLELIRQVEKNGKDHTDSMQDTVMLALSGNRLVTQNLSFNGYKVVEIFNSDDVSVGDILVGLIELPSIQTDKYAYVELLDSNDERLAAYGKTLNRSNSVRYFFKFTIPEGFNRAIFKVNAIAELKYIKHTNGLVLDRKINIKTNGTSLVSQSIPGLLSNGKYIVTIPNFSFNNSLGDYDDVLKITDGLGQTIASYRYRERGWIPKYMEVNNPGYSQINIFINDDANVEHEFCIYNSEENFAAYDDVRCDILEDKIQDYNSESKKTVDDIAGNVGLLSVNVLLNETNSPSSGVLEVIELFNSSDVSVGDKLTYKITLNDKTIVGFNAYIELLDSNDTRLAIYGKTSIGTSELVYQGEILIPTGFAKAVLRGSAKASLDYISSKYSNKAIKDETDAAIENINETLSHITVIENVNSIGHISFVGSPIELISNKDPDATELDNRLINFTSIVKVSDSLYYMYYTCSGQNDVTDESQHLCFAYSEDCRIWHRGFPQGVEPPVQGTNLLFDYSVIEHCVCKVNDSEYPYRLVGNTTRDNIYQIVTLFKSADGIHFIKVRELSNGGNDTQNSVIVRGNTLKIYVRAYAATSGGYRRSIGIIYCDLDGNIISPQVKAIDLGEDTAQPYNSAASILDDHREILFPTIYNPSNSQETLSCMIVNHERYNIVTIDSTSLLSPYGSFYVVPGLINIEKDMYMAIAVRTTNHEQTQNMVGKILLVKIQLTA